MLKTNAAKLKERDRALRQAIERACVDLNLPKDYQRAERLGLEPKTYAARKKDVLHAYGFKEAVQMSDRLGFTAGEILAIFGLDGDKGAAPAPARR